MVARASSPLSGELSHCQASPSGYHDLRGPGDDARLPANDGCCGCPARHATGEGQAPRMSPVCMRGGTKSIARSQMCEMPVPNCRHCGLDRKLANCRHDGVARP